PYLTNINVLQNPIKSDTAVHLIKRLSLKPDENFFSFEFSSIAFTAGDKNTFRYRLLNFDDNWTTASERKFANYTNVPPGEYKFQLQVANNEGIWNEKPCSLSVHIARPWWNTAWFWLLSAIGIAGLVYSIYMYRTRQIRKEERLRLHYEQRLSDMEMSALRAQMNPHFIFNAMNSIEYFIINNEQEKAIDYLNRFSRLIRLILQNSKSTIVPLKDDLEALKLYLEIENMRFDELFEYEIKIEKNLDTALIKVPPMLMQPYVENAIWHGLLQKKRKDGKIGLTIRKDKGSLICLIEDNGIGRAAAEQLKSKSGTRKKSFGMKITSDRLEALNKITGTNASVHIYDLQNKEHEPAGTRVELIIPV
ncbi:MAG: histidine kinase, partial [Bacteroidia bacterium]